MHIIYLYLKVIFTLFCCIFILDGGDVYAFQTNRLLSDTTTKINPKPSSNPKNKISDTRTNKPSFVKNGIKVTFVPFKPNSDKINNTKSSSAATSIKVEDDTKILNNVKVYPNPVSDQLNLTYNVNKDSNVTIKIMDVLGNEITTLLSQHLTAGEQNNSFSIPSRLNTGFYFIRLIVGNETIIKRISVL